MTLHSAKPLLLTAQTDGYAVPLFECFELLGAEGTFDAIAAQRAPAILGVYSQWIEKPFARAFVAYLRARAEDLPYPLALMLDHGRSYETCLLALQHGLTDVMFDGSALPIEENIAITRRLVEVAHAQGAAVEAELGHVGVGADYATPDKVRAGYTDPALAERFVAETGVDFLAVAIGTAHGVYQGTPVLDLERLAQIRERVSVPLVLHGGSGLSDAQFRAAIALGICKVNIFTDLGLTARRLATEACQQENASYLSIGDAFTRAFFERCSFFLDLFGASGRG